MLNTEKMSGLDCLREEMKRRGCNNSQINSKIVAIVMDIIANSEEGLYTAQWGAEQKVKEALETAARLNAACVERKKELNDLEEKLIKQADEQNKYIDNFLQKMNECETPQQRDAMRTAQLFINTVNVDTKYDNTAFIVGLAGILSRANISAVDELHKINPNVPGWAYVATRR